MNFFLLAALTVFGVDPYADNPHLPDALPSDARETTSFATFAAQGEIESASWLVRSDVPVAALDCRLSDLKGPDGATIPASALDLKVVKVWFQPSGFWTTSWAGDINRPVAIPAILLHDDSLVRVDWTNKVNHLRIDYADGPTYCRMSGKDLTDELNHSIHPIRDAAAYVPCALEAGRLKQFWLTVKTPPAAKPGVYRGTVTLADGVSSVTLRLSHTVHPFALPRPRTHYDSSRPYIVSIEHNVTVQDYLQQGHDLAHAERKSLAAYRTLVEHNVCEATGPGMIRRESPDDLAYRTLHVMRRAGMPMEVLCSATGESAYGGAVAGPDRWPEVEGYAKLMTSLFDRFAAPGYRAYFTGIDEAPVEQCRAQYGTWSSLKMHGCLAQSAMADVRACGWSLDLCQTPALVSHSHARAWHRLGGRVVTYASPFAGPECPAIWRRTKGLRFYYSDFDGICEYCLYYHARNRWNEFIPSPDNYRSFGLVYPAYEELIGTIAFEALREGIDDIRYLSLLRLRAEAALGSGDPEKVLLGKRHLAWMDSRDPERVGPLDAFRLELVRRITELIAAVGPEPSAPPALRPMPELARTSTDALAADASVPALVRAAACVKADRYELAIPLYAAVRSAGGPARGDEAPDGAARPCRCARGTRFASRGRGDSGGAQGRSGAPADGAHADAGQVPRALHGAADRGGGEGARTSEGTRDFRGPPLLARLEPREGHAQFGRSGGGVRIRREVRQGERFWRSAMRASSLLHGRGVPSSRRKGQGGVQGVEASDRARRSRSERRGSQSLRRGRRLCRDLRRSHGRAAVLRQVPLGLAKGQRQVVSALERVPPARDEEGIRHDQGIRRNQDRRARDLPG